MKKNWIFGLVFFVIVVHASACGAQSNYECYIFGVNIKTFKNSNWKAVAAGALSSLVVHELGHALYLSSQGEDWHLSVSTSGLAIETDARLSASQYRYFGSAGFALQSAIGSLLTSFDKTRRTDFTKGWVSMNTAQFWTYPVRSHDHGDDFDLIEKGDGNKDAVFSAFALISEYNKMAALRPHILPMGIPFNPMQGADLWPAAGNEKAVVHEQDRMRSPRSLSHDLQQNWRLDE